MDGMNN